MIKTMLGAALAVLLCAPSVASALTVTGNGLTDTSLNYACGVSPCLSNKVLTLDAPAAATGTITIDAGAGTADIDLTLATFTYVGDVNGAVDEVVFSGVSYTATVDITISGDDISQDGVASGAVAGSYEQFLGGGSVVADQAFGTTPTFSNLSCLVTGGTGQCGLCVGLGVPVLPDFPLDVGGSTLEVVNTFNLIVVPEPSTGALLAMALLTVVTTGRAARKS